MAATTQGTEIHRLRPSDRDAVQALLEKTGVFTPQEIDVAMEIVDLALAEPEQKDYELWCALDDQGRLSGYVCFGRTPCTDAVWDLYWIAVGPGEQRRGVGSRLLLFVEEWVKRERARMLVIETSSQPRYEGTRAFYLRHQYEELARVRDFYFVGDDKVEYGKRFSYGGA
ncbi:MAG: GNAT family N-acetyltransferase [Planctomycetota bacterium]|mgnify:FL=1